MPGFSIQTHTHGAHPWRSHAHRAVSDTTNPAQMQKQAPTADQYTEPQHDSHALWSPEICRRQSFNEQDRKHELQMWLTRTEQGKESGFSEDQSRRASGYDGGL